VAFKFAASSYLTFLDSYILSPFRCSGVGCCGGAILAAVVGGVRCFMGVTQPLLLGANSQNHVSKMIETLKLFGQPKSLVKSPIHRKNSKSHMSLWLTKCRETPIRPKRGCRQKPREGNVDPIDKMQETPDMGLSPRPEKPAGMKENLPRVTFGRNPDMGKSPQRTRMGRRRPRSKETEPPEP